jgi:hypothetical protein
MGQIIAKCWADESFKQRLLADTHATLIEEGAVLLHGLTVKAVENIPTMHYLVIPAKPTDLFDDADLEKEWIRGGVCPNLQLLTNVTQPADHGA